MEISCREGLHVTIAIFCNKLGNLIQLYQNINIENHNIKPTQVEVDISMAAKSNNKPSNAIIGDRQKWFYEDTN